VDRAFHELVEREDDSHSDPNAEERPSDGVAGSPTQEERTDGRVQEAGHGNGRHPQRALDEARWLGGNAADDIEGEGDQDGADGEQPCDGRRPSQQDPGIDSRAPGAFHHSCL
jgi:hypothetical protein